MSANPIAARAAPRDLVETARAAGDFMTFSSALTASGLVDELKGPGPFTLFAPTDEAFRKLPPEEVEALMRDRARLGAMINRHVLRGRLYSTDLTHGDATTVDGTSIHIGATDDGFTIDHANVIRKDIFTSNGVIHAIDAVIIPGRIEPKTRNDTQESAWSGKRRIPPPPRR